MKNKMIIVGVLVILAGMFLTSGVHAFADTMCVDFQVTDITPSSVEIGEEVTVGIQLDNCGSELPENVRFEITRFSNDIIIKEPLVIDSKKPFGYANSDRFNIYHLYVTDKATPGEYVFEYKLTYGNKDFSIEKEGNFSVTVTSQESDLNIAYVKTEPILPKVGDEVTLTIRLENFGRGDANSVKAKVDIPFFGIKESFLGELESGDDSSAVFTLVPDKSGVIDYDLIVTYKDDFGAKEFTESLELNIQENPRSNALTIIIIIALISLVGGIIYYFKSKKALNKKEEK